MSHVVQSRLARFLKYYHQRRNKRGLVEYERRRDMSLKRLALAGISLVAMLYMLELAAVVASVSTWCIPSTISTSRTCN